MKLKFLADGSYEEMRKRQLQHEEKRKNDKKLLRELTLQVCQLYNMPEQRVFWEDIQRGYAYLGQNKIKMPTWILAKEFRYQQAYLLHEIAHQLQYKKLGKSTNHDEQFMLIETKLCRKYINLIPLYNRKRGYCIAFMDLNSHELICDSLGNSPYSELFTLSVKNYD